MRPLRIAIVHPYSWPAVRRGGERYLADLAWFLTTTGHQVDVITSRDGPATRQAWRVRPVPSVAPGWLARRGVSAVETFGASALGALLRRRYDVVHALTPSAAIAARLAGQRTVYTVLGHPAPELVERFSSLQRQLMARAVRSADVVAALSTPSAAAVQHAFGRAAHILPPGVRLDRFPLEPQPRLGPPRILFPSFAANPHKGLGTLIDALALLRRVVPDARLEIAGPGDAGWALDRADPATRAAVDVLGVGDLDELPLRYASAAVTALPSLYEAFGLVLVESLACGTPVVCASTSSGSTDIVDHPAIGRAVPFADAGALARALEETIVLARDPVTPRRCRDHARRWDWEEAVGPAHSSLYRELTAASLRRNDRAGGNIP